MEKKARIFNRNVTYQSVRPGYPRDVYDLVAHCKTLDSSSTILEVGAGHGIATEEIAQYWQPKIDALEPGANLATLLRARMSEYRDIRIYETGFEEYDSAGKRYDALFSATAFHWLDKAVKYKKSYDLLKPDGMLVVYWNN